MRSLYLLWCIAVLTCCRVSGGERQPDVDAQVTVCDRDDDCQTGASCLDPGTSQARCEPRPTSPPSGAVKVMTYNVREGGVNPAWKDVVRAENADIIVFVETSDWDTAKVDALLDEFNEHFSTGLYAPPADRPPYVAHAEPDPPPYGGTAIFSRYPILDVTPIDSLTLDDMSPWAPIRVFMLWELDVDGIPMFVTGVHPKCCGGASNELRRERDIEGLINWLDDFLASGNIVIAGDFNAFSYADEQAGNNQGDLGHGPLEILLDENPGDFYDTHGSTRHAFYDGYRSLVPDISAADHTYRNGSYRSRIDFILVGEGLQPALVGPASVGASTASDPGSDHFTVDIHLDLRTLRKNLPDDTRTAREAAESPALAGSAGRSDPW